VNLLELHSLRGLRQNHDLQMSRIRRALAWLQSNVPSPHPLLDRAMETDGVDLFLRHYGELITVSRDGQLAMKEVFEAHLRRIDRDAQGLPIRFFPFTRRFPPATPRAIALSEEAQPRLVSIDPQIAFGRPVLAEYRIPTGEVIERFNAGDLIAAIAADYECPPQAIEEAIRWERAAA
jgi:uncharacterized protein (DUF433 family)